MICPPCREAGNWNKDAPLYEVSEKAWVMAGLNHGDCLGKTHCDCQHKVGPTEKFIDIKKVKSNGKVEEN